MKPRVYMETTIPSYLVARPSRDLRLAADQETTQEWWDERRHDYELFASPLVAREVSRGDPRFAEAGRKNCAESGCFCVRPRLRR